MRVKVIALAVAILAFAAFFLFVPVVPVTTYPTEPGQLAFLRISTTESMSCALAGVGAANWPVPPYQGTITLRYELGCPPKAGASYTVG